MSELDLLRMREVYPLSFKVMQNRRVLFEKRRHCLAYAVAAGVRWGLSTDQIFSIW